MSQVIQFPPWRKFKLSAVLLLLCCIEGGRVSAFMHKRFYILFPQSNKNQLQGRVSVTIILFPTEGKAKLDWPMLYSYRGGRVNAIPVLHIWRITRKHLFRRYKCDLKLKRKKDGELVGGDNGIKEDDIVFRSRSKTC